jgi:hypothetical protein
VRRSGLLRREYGSAIGIDQFLSDSFRLRSLMDRPTFRNVSSYRGWGAVRPCQANPIAIGKQPRDRSSID